MRSVHPGISLITTFHREGAIAKQTVESLRRCIEPCLEAMIPIEWIAAVDRGDLDTKRIVSQASMPCHSIVLELDHGSLGLSRNSCVAASSMDVIAVTDGDDYYSRNWLVEGYKHVQNDPKSIAHPEFVVSFGAQNSFVQHIDQRDPLFDEDSLLTVNHWVSCAMAKSKAFTEMPYTDNLKPGYGYEDWHWNSQTIASGYCHDLVKKTAIFYRRKAGGMLSAERASWATIARTELFLRKDSQE